MESVNKPVFYVLIVKDKVCLEHSSAADYNIFDKSGCNRSLYYFLCTLYSTFYSFITTSPSVIKVVDF